MNYRVAALLQLSALAMDGAHAAVEFPCRLADADALGVRARFDRARHQADLEFPAHVARLADDVAAAGRLVFDNLQPSSHPLAAHLSLYGGGLWAILYLPVLPVLLLGKASTAHHCIGPPYRRKPANETQGWCQRADRSLFEGLTQDLADGAKTRPASPVGAGATAAKVASLALVGKDWSRLHHRKRANGYDASIADFEDLGGKWIGRGRELPDHHLADAVDEVPVLRRPQVEEVPIGHHGKERPAQCGRDDLLQVRCQDQRGFECQIGLENAEPHAIYFLVRQLCRDQRGGEVVRCRCLQLGERYVPLVEHRLGDPGDCPPRRRDIDRYPVDLLRKRRAQIGWLDMIGRLQGEQDGRLSLSPGPALEPIAEHEVDERGD